MKDDQRVLLTKRLLREGLLRLLETKSIHSIKISELCQVSGINRATFYRHYQQPRDLIAELRYEMFSDIRALAEKNDARKDPTRWLEDMCQYFYDSSRQLRLLFQCRTDEEFVEMINEAYQLQLRELPGRGTAVPDDATRKMHTYFLAGGIYYLLRQWLTEPIEKTPRETAMIIRRFLVNIV